MALAEFHDDAVTSSTAQSRALDRAEAQHGLATREQILAAGVSERTLRRRVADGVWLPMGGGVFRARGVQDDLSARSLALAMRFPEGVLTGVSAATMWGRGAWEGLDLGQTPWIVLPRRRNVQARFLSHPGIRFRYVEGARVAHPAYAVVDLIRFLAPDAAHRVAFRALQARVLSLEFLEASLVRLTRRAGTRQLRHAVELARTGVRSEAERRFVAMLRDGGITGFEVNYSLALPNGRRAIIDVAFPGLMLAIEIDGLAYHSAPDQRQHDLSRQNQLVLLGWEPLRFTWSDIVERPEPVLSILRHALERRRRERGGS